jgi:hypothetical protein
VIAIMLDHLAIAHQRILKDWPGVPWSRFCIEIALVQVFHVESIETLSCDMISHIYDLLRPLLNTCDK